MFFPLLNPKGCRNPFIIVYDYLPCSSRLSLCCYLLLASTLIQTAHNCSHNIPCSFTPQALTPTTALQLEEGSVLLAAAAVSCQPVDSAPPGGSGRHQPKSMLALCAVCSPTPTVGVPGFLTPALAQFEHPPPDVTLGSPVCRDAPTQTAPTSNTTASTPTKDVFDPEVNTFSVVSGLVHRPPSARSPAQPRPPSHPLPSPTKHICLTSVCPIQPFVTVCAILSPLSNTPAPRPVSSSPRGCLRSWGIKASWGSVVRAGQSHSL